MRSREPQALQRLLHPEQGGTRKPLRFVDGAEQQDSALRKVARREVEQLERGRIGPVQVVEHDEQGAARGQRLEELRERPAELEVRVRRARRGIGAGDAGTEQGEEHLEFRLRAPGEDRQRLLPELLEGGEQRVGEERVGHARLDGVRTPGGDRQPQPPRLLRHGSGQAALAHAPLAGEEDGPAPAVSGMPEQALQTRQVVGAPHEGEAYQRAEGDWSRACRRRANAHRVPAGGHGVRASITLPGPRPPGSEPPPRATWLP